MDKPKAHCCLLLPCFLFPFGLYRRYQPARLISHSGRCRGENMGSQFQHQSSFTEQSIKEITEPDLKPGDLLFSSSLGVTSFGIRVFSTSSVSHVAIYLGENNVAEATGAGVQIVSLKKAMKHSDKLFVLRVPDLTPQQATEITAFANKIKDSGYNYRGIVEFIPFMVTRQMCSLNPFSEDFRQQCVSGTAKAQLSSVGEGDKKSWFCSEFVTDAFAKAGHPLTLAQSGWISPADLMHMRTGDVSAFKPETQLQYVGHLKPRDLYQGGSLCWADSVMKAGECSGFQLLPPNYCNLGMGKISLPYRVLILWLAHRYPD